MKPVLVLQKFGRVRRLLNAKLSAELRRYDIGPTQAFLIRSIAQMQQCSLAELSREAHTDPAATGKTVDALIREGYIVKQEHSTDRRRWVLTLTAEGGRLAKKLDEVWATVAKDLVEVFSEKQQKAFFQLLSLAENRLLESKSDL